MPLHIPTAAVVLEGNYTSYAAYDSFDDSNILYIFACVAFINRLETKATLITYDTINYLKVYDIETKTLGTAINPSDQEFFRGGELHTKFRASFLNTYLAVLEKVTLDLLIYKNGALLQRLTPTDLGLSSATSCSISFSPCGKYIFLVGTLLASGNKGWVVLKGT